MCKLIIPPITPRYVEEENGDVNEVDEIDHIDENNIEDNELEQRLWAEKARENDNKIIQAFHYYCIRTRPVEYVHVDEFDVKSREINIEQRLVQIRCRYVGLIFKSLLAKAEYSGEEFQRFSEDDHHNFKLLENDEFHVQFEDNGIIIKVRIEEETKYLWMKNIEDENSEITNNQEEKSLNITSYSVEHAVVNEYKIISREIVSKLREVHIRCRYIGHLFNSLLAKVENSDEEFQSFREDENHNFKLLKDEEFHVQFEDDDYIIKLRLDEETKIFWHPKIEVKNSEFTENQEESPSIEC